MGSLRVRLVDRNRFAKRYPLVRAPARMTYIGDSEISIEIGSIYFNNVESGILTYDAQFPDTEYQIIAITRSDGTNDANVNVFVTNKTQNTVTVEASSNFTGYVDVLAVRIV